MTFRFLYKTPGGALRNDIIIEATNLEEALMTFEQDRPNHKWYQATELNK